MFAHLLISCILLNTCLLFSLFFLTHTAYAKTVICPSRQLVLKWKEPSVIIIALYAYLNWGTLGYAFFLAYITIIYYIYN